MTAGAPLTFSSTTTDRIGTWHSNLEVSRFGPEYVGNFNFYVQPVEAHMHDRARDAPPLGGGWSSAATTSP